MDGSPNVFRTNADPHRVAQCAMYAGNPHGDSQLPRGTDRPRVRKHARKCVVDSDLCRLCGACGKLPPPLHSGKILIRHPPVLQGHGEKVGCRDGILDG